MRIILKYLRKFIWLNHPGYEFYSLHLVLDKIKNSKEKSALMSLYEIKKVCKGLPKIYYLQISGEESFSRQDLSNICKSFIEINSTKFITISTDGEEPEKVAKITKDLVKNKCLFGIGVRTDKIFNSGKNNSDKNLQKALATYKRLQSIAKNNKNLKIKFSSIMTKGNANSLKDLHKLLKSSFPLSYHVVIPDICPKNTPTAAQYIHNIKKIKLKKGLLSKSRYNFVHFLLGGNGWPFDCIAGKNIGVIYSNGNVKLCEMHKPIGNLKDYGYSFYRIWNSDKAAKQRELIKYRKCTKGCTNPVMLEASIIKNPLNILKIIRLKKSFP